MLIDRGVMAGGGGCDLSQGDSGPEKEKGGLGLNQRGPHFRTVTE